MLTLASSGGLFYASCSQEGFYGCLSFDAPELLATHVNILL